MRTRRSDRFSNGQSWPKESFPASFLAFGLLKLEGVMVRFADERLDRGGSLVAALRRHYGRQIAARPHYVDFMTGIGRRAEVDMAELMA